MISATDYDDTTETITITAGPPEGLIYPIYTRPPKLREYEDRGGPTREAIPGPEMPPERWTPDMVVHAASAESGGGSGNNNKPPRDWGLNKKGKPYVAGG